jgi:hypothetical protein
MTTPPNGKLPANPHKNRNCEEDSPTPVEAIIRCTLRFFHGFHLHRERSKVTDWLTVALTLGVAIAAIWSALIFQDQLKEARKQTRLSVRPWIGLDEGLDAIQTTPLQIDEGGNASLVYTIRAKNYSSSPAANVWAYANLVVADDLNTVYEQQGYACGDAVVGKPDIGLVLFQGKDRVFNSMPGLTKISVKHERSLIGAWLAGCIGYRDQFGYLCRTKFIWGFQDETGRPVSLQAPVPAMMIKGRFFPTASGGAIDTCQIPKYK